MTEPNLDPISQETLIRILQETITSMQKTIERQAEELTRANDTIEALQKTIENLTEQIRLLNEKLNKNSKNSSKPPSSDGLKKPTSLRKPSGKKPGGQKGHSGANLMLRDNPDTVITHMPSPCENCPCKGTCQEKSCVKERRQIIDISIKTEVTEHQTLEVVCPFSRAKLQGEMPEDVTATVQYGKNLQALVVALNTIGAVSIHRTHEILGGVFDIPLAEGTISRMVSGCSTSLDQVLERIRLELINSEIVHFDETGSRVDGKTWWVHNASNASYTLLTLNKKRGAIGIREGKVADVYTGIGVHDCWKPYWQFSMEHAVCCAHLLRELNGVMENHPQQTWAKQFSDLLLDMKQKKEKAIGNGKSSLSYYHLHKFDQRYTQIIETACEENPIPEKVAGKRGRPKKGKVRALIERLREYKAGFCLFIKNFAVPFDNNQAERDVRMVKVKTKVSGCFRTEAGAEDYLRIMSYVGTAKKHGIKGFTAIRYAISGTPEIIFA